MKRSLITFITILSIACCSMNVTAQASTVTEADEDNLEQAEQSIYYFFNVFERGCGRFSGPIIRSIQAVSGTG